MEPPFGVHSKGEMNGTMELNSTNKTALVRLCQQVMTQDVVMTCLAFKRRFNKLLATEMNPLVVQTLKDNAEKLYAFLDIQRDNPMRVALSQGMTDVFLGFVTVSSSCITSMLMRYNKKFIFKGRRGITCIHLLRLKHPTLKMFKPDISFKLCVPFPCSTNCNDNVFVDKTNVVDALDGEEVTISSERCFKIRRDIVHLGRSIVGKALVDYYDNHPDRKASIKRWVKKEVDRDVSLAYVNVPRPSRGGGYYTKQEYHPRVWNYDYHY